MNILTGDTGPYPQRLHVASHYLTPPIRLLLEQLTVNYHVKDFRFSD